MDELGFNKIAAAALATFLAFFGIRTLADAVVPEPDFEAVYVPDVVIDDGSGEEAPSDPLHNDPRFIAAMDASAGATVFRKCQSCHNVERGGPNGTGPNMWGVMGRTMGTHQGFAYSAAMRSRAAPWTWEEMNNFLIRPKDWIPGTAMNYIGLRNWEDRAAVMAYLNENTDNPLPIPEAVEPVEAMAEFEALPDELGNRPTSDLRSDVLGSEDPNDQVPPRMEGGEQVEDIPGEDDATDAEIVAAAGEDLDEDAMREADEAAEDDGFNSAGEVTAEDLSDPSVREAIVGEQPSEDLETLDGPRDADEVLDFLRRRGG